jgi:flavoprotein
LWIPLKEGIEAQRQDEDRVTWAIVGMSPTLLTNTQRSKAITTKDVNHRLTLFLSSLVVVVVVKVTIKEKK